MRGAFCDYSGLSYKKLEGGSGIQWPCNDQYPDGCERLYEDLVFRTEADLCESFGHDMELGAAIPKMEYKAQNPAGKAMLKSANYLTPPHAPSEQFPFMLMTGRVI
jgi:predicted molibdopterin-dependent oxidoreductase YjgC